MTERLRVRGCWLALVAALALTPLLLASHPALAKTSHRRDRVNGEFVWDYYKRLQLDASKVRNSSDKATGTIELSYDGMSGWLFKADIKCLRVKRHGASVVARITDDGSHSALPIYQVGDLYAWTFYDLSSPGGSDQGGKDLVGPNPLGTKVDSATCERPPSDPPASATGFQWGDVTVKDMHRR